MTQENLNKMPTVESMKGAINYLNSQIDSRRANMQQRMENYFNCTDDYSFGGLCDQAAIEEIAKCKSEINVIEAQIENIEAQIENGKPFSETFVQHVLLDENNNIVADTIVHGQYGDCFIIKNGRSAKFVSLAKKLSTFTRKGYKLGEQKITYEYFYTVNLSGAMLISVGEVINMELTVGTAVPTSWNRVMPRELYFAINKQ